MDGRFADNPKIRPAMAGGARAAADGDTGMVKRSSGKRCRRQVTGFAGSGGREMVRRLRDNPTDPMHPGPMATGTTGRNPRMSHRSSRPKGGRIVAGFAPCSGWEMACRLGDDIADKPRSGRMARGTATGDATMVHQGPAECQCGLMAGLTSRRGKR